MEKMSFEEFKEYVKDNIKALLPVDEMDSTVTIKQVNKGFEPLYGLTIIAQGRNISPTIYLEPYYNDYIDSVYDNISEVMMNIKDVYMRHRDNKIDVNLVNEFVNYEKAKERLYLAPMAKGADYKGTVPYVENAGLRFMAKIDAGSFSEGRASCTVTNDMLERWEITEEVVLKDAKENTANILKPNLIDMTEMFDWTSGMITTDNEIKNYMNEQVQDLSYLYILTTEDKLNAKDCNLKVYICNRL